MTYLGKTVPVEPLLADLRRAAQRSGFRVQALLEVDSLPLLAFSRPGGTGAPAVYISAGIHGNEPAGPLALLDMINEGLPTDVSWFICPALNPGGLKLGTRESPTGADLNRDYLSPKEPEIQAHVQWLDEQDDFDLALFLHEDWEANGFYIYELNPNHNKSFAADIIAAVDPVCPVERAKTIDNHRASGGIIHPAGGDLKRVDWPEALYLFTHHNRLNCTFETPSAFPLHTRVEAHEAACRAAVAALLRG